MDNMMHSSFIWFGKVQTHKRSWRLIKICQALPLFQLLSSDNHSKDRLHISNNQLIIHVLPWQPGRRLATVTSRVWQMAVKEGSWCHGAIHHLQTNTVPVQSRHMHEELTEDWEWLRRRPFAPPPPPLHCRAHPNRALLFRPPFTASLRWNLCLRCGPGFAFGAEFAQRCASVHDGLLLAHLARRRKHARKACGAVRWLEMMTGSGGKPASQAVR